MFCNLTSSLTHICLSIKFSSFAARVTLSYVDPRYYATTKFSTPSDLYPATCFSLGDYYMLISKSLNAGCDGAWALSRWMTREHAVEVTCILLYRASATVRNGLTIRISDTIHKLSRLDICKDLTQLY